jgi:hypothetical protein
MEEGKKTAQCGSFPLPENFKLKTGNFHSTFSLQRDHFVRAPFIWSFVACPMLSYFYRTFSHPNHPISETTDAFIQ